MTTEVQRPAKQIGRNNLIKCPRTGEWVRTKEVLKLTSGAQDSKTGEKDEKVQIFIRLEDGHELVYGADELVWRQE
ncbi:hypothetical protein [Mycobacterium colombiense]|uniref:hypothetical protein n=1 Tax=Mycobacterium colombiense TaxID=339268 RepID=UPI0011502397|nr:hypothetical protein [Mycobacterium colombiense]